MTLPRYI